ncbi:hypothetical protein ACE6H2_012199 [Prunus campanulata]
MWVSAKPPFSISKILKPFCRKSHAQVSILNLYQPQLSICGLGELRVRIDSMKCTQKITEAMKLVESARVRRTQEAVINRQPFAEAVVEVLYDINERRGGFRRQEGKGVGTGAGGVAEQVGLVGGGAW